MNIKKFIAASAQEAIRMVKGEMGPEAVILGSRTLRTNPNPFGQPEKQVEVTAAIDYSAPQLTNSPLGQEDSMALIEKWQRLETELKEIKDVLLSADAHKFLKPEIYFNEALKAHYSHFKTFGLKPDVIMELMRNSTEMVHGPKKSNASLLKSSLASVLKRIDVDRDRDPVNQPQVYSFIGPTGVGKTTTLAKLAAIEAIKRNKKVALITLDTFRIAAVSQLRTYARIIEIPIEVAVDRTDLQRALGKHMDCDLLFIDTAGRSPNSSQDLYELKNLLQIKQKIHHYLVLSATSHYQNLVQAEKRFGVLSCGSYIFTKLDEAQDASDMLNFLLSKPKSVSFFTTGQKVPEDIEAATRKRLAMIMLARMRGMAEIPVNDEVKGDYGSSYPSKMHRG
ncbi:flagellar biosynthesis protein FlhF [Thermodesulfobacteriota bacterium]